MRCEGEMQQHRHVELTAAGVVFGDPILVGFVRRWEGDEQGSTVR